MRERRQGVRPRAEYLSSVKVSQQHKRHIAKVWHREFVQRRRKRAIAFVAMLLSPDEITEMLTMIELRSTITQLIWKVSYAPKPKVISEETRCRQRTMARRWRKQNPEHVRALKIKRRAKIKRAGGSFTGEDITAQRQRQKNCCYWCQCSLKAGHHIDHIWPLSKGGSNGPENICLACPTCNLTKNAKTPMEFAGRLL